MLDTPQFPSLPFSWLSFTLVHHVRGLFDSKVYKKEYILLDMLFF